MWYKYTMEYYSAIKKNEMLPLAEMWMNLEGITVGEISQTEKTKTICFYMWNLKIKTSEHNKKRKRLTGVENKLVITSEEKVGGKDKIEVGD